MASEQSYLDRVQRAGDLNAAVSLLDPAYAPADEKFTLSKLTAAIISAETANTKVGEQRVPYQDPAGERVTLVKSIGPLVTQALAYVKSNTAWEKRFDAVKKAADKVRGVRPPGKKVKDPEPDKKARESGDHSYVEIAVHLKSFVDRLEALADYAPQDPKIGIAPFRAMWTELDGFNKALPLAAQTLADAITDRQQAAKGATGLKFVFDGVKTSVKGQYGQRSSQYAAVKGIKW